MFKPAALLTLSLLHLCTSLPFDDPSTWPGHLEPFGSKQKTVDIEVYYEWPSPKDFFEKFVDKTIPALFRGVNKASKALHLWTDEYFTANKASEETPVIVEPYLKENRTGEKLDMSFSQFIASYHKQPLLMFSTIPEHFMQDHLMPAPLTCNETRKHLVNVMGIISQGGSKSVVCNEDVETLLCPVQGVTDVLLIEYTRNKNYVIDTPQGGYSTLDVERVDYVKYPNLRKVDQYVRAQVREGDCLYIPYRWYKQMNAHANTHAQNIALNIWWKHLHDHVPVTCEMSPRDATLDKFEYTDLAEQGVYSEGYARQMMDARPVKEGDIKGGSPIEGGKGDVVDGEEMERRDLLKHFYRYFKATKTKNMTFDDFYNHLKTDEDITQQQHDELHFPDTHKTLAQELFQKFDINNNSHVETGEFRKIVKNGTLLKKYHAYLEYQVARIEDYTEDLVEAKHHDEPLHKFEERIKEKWRFERKFDEL